MNRNDTAGPDVLPLLGGVFRGPPQAIVPPIEGRASVPDVILGPDGDLAALAPPRAEPSLHRLMALRAVRRAESVVFHALRVAKNAVLRLREVSGFRGCPPRPETPASRALRAGE